MISQCIKVLETPGKKKTVMTKTQALRTLIHLVGDIHQPLHVSSGYYDFGPDGQATLITDPVKAKGAPSDQGAIFCTGGLARSKSCTGTGISTWSSASSAA